mmetsp:Transcript_25421/g.4214  ORF Transcript_25421/g.4214 Transcript_25421/m.4214 type:complete len:93 (-) Transcript_25421:752-1030(-)
MGLVLLTDQLKKGKGLSIFGTCKVGESNKENFANLFDIRVKIHEFFKMKRLEIFTKVILAKTARKGLKILIQTAGLGGLEPNTVMLAWPENW